VRPDSSDGAERGAQSSGATTQPARVIICDDHRIVAEGLVKLVEPPHIVTAVTTSGAELVAILPTASAECLLLDLQMPGRNGLDLLPDLRRLRPDLKIIIVTMHADRFLVNACFSAGAHGFVPKDAGREEVLTAIADVRAGRRYLSPRVPKTSQRVGLAAWHLGFDRLTPRQQQIVTLMGEGKRPSEIARALGVSPSTVTFHIQHAMCILGVTTEGALLRLAVLLAAGEGPPAEPVSPRDKVGAPTR
jgi:DNA-binding NarL/FixJ family response regulator